MSFFLVFLLHTIKICIDVSIPIVFIFYFYSQTNFKWKKWKTLKQLASLNVQSWIWMRTFKLQSHFISLFPIWLLLTPIFQYILSFGWTLLDLKCFSSMRFLTVQFSSFQFIFQLFHWSYPQTLSDFGWKVQAVFSSCVIFRSFWKLFHDYSFLKVQFSFASCFLVLSQLVSICEVKVLFRFQVQLVPLSFCSFFYLLAVDSSPPPTFI